MIRGTKPKMSLFSRLPEREDMTLCIAAFASEWTEKKEIKASTYFCADARIETPVAGSDTEYKLRKVTDDWAAMFAGNVGRAVELLSLYTSYLSSRPFSEQEILNDLRTPPQMMKKRLANEYVSSMTGLSFDDLVKDGQTILPAAQYENIWTDIMRIEIGCQLILIPTSRTGLYVVDCDGSVNTRRNFCTIGTGSSNAEAWLHFREQNKFTSPERTAAHLLEAKRFSEHAPGVGKTTHLACLDNDQHLYQYQRVEDTEKKIWKTHGPRKTTSVKITPHKFAGNPIKWQELAVG